MNRRQPPKTGHTVIIDLSKQPDGFCAVAIREGLLTDKQAKTCLDRQLSDLLKGKNRLIGEYLKEAGFIDDQGILRVRALQLAEESSLGRAHTKNMDRLGQLAVEENMISEETLKGVLREQKEDAAKGTAKPLGSYMQSRGRVDKKGIKRLRKIQGKRRRRLVRHVRRQSNPLPVMLGIAAGLALFAFLLFHI